MPFWKGFKLKAPSVSAAAGEASKMRALRSQVRSGVPYAALEPEKVPQAFNVSGFLKGTQMPKKTP